MKNAKSRHILTVAPDSVAICTEIPFFRATRLSRDAKCAIKATVLGWNKNSLHALGDRIYRTGFASSTTNSFLMNKKSVYSDALCARNRTVLNTISHPEK